MSRVLSACSFLVPFLLVPLSLLAQTVPIPPVPVLPSIAFEAQSAVASGLTPSGPVVWFGVARESAEGVATIVRRDRLDKADALGVARVDLDRDIPFKSIWVALDLTTGLAAIATPANFPLVQVDLPLSDLLAGGADSALADAIQSGRDAVEVLLVRPGSGAWGLTVGRGGVNDESGGDGPMRVSLTHLKPIGASPAPPSKLSAKDVVILIDPNRLEIASLRVAGGLS